jgi:ribonuclease-3 family protein
LAKEAQSYVNAGAQAKILKRISLFLTENERKIIARGKNAKSKTSAKNASPKDYAEATALESLFGYLELKNDQKRINELVRIILYEVGAV